MKLETQCIHAGVQPDPTTNALKAIGLTKDSHYELFEREVEKEIAKDLSAESAKRQGTSV